MQRGPLPVAPLLPEVQSEGMGAALLQGVQLHCSFPQQVVSFLVDQLIVHEVQCIQALSQPLQV